ncbi:glycerophosphodiester phosphodiesterase [Brachybacterium sp. MASK1Z-5]|uniref:Glycerophosphodiester phosphodiesterase n=1 Tax=Brachybacterium halotolerans TaxID=2795215 RepID=A0ABS1B7B7_9MICO|nr:glycerophosphodiester phosphodiesterase family protein [Brachybacterium halotolerans]MBK0330541.1 glycerophosphodiester phosphodiesterase [Brachybacterium halotolerans]
MQPKIVGHRGAARLAPENTLRAFRAGVDAGADLLECDVHLSADGQLVIMHDTTIDRTAAEDSPLRSGALAELTRAELDTVLLPDGERVPSLEAVLDIAQGAGVPIFVEVKAVAAAEQTAQLLVDRDLDQSRDGVAPAWIISFKPEALRAARAVAPQIPLSAITHVADEDFWALAEELRTEAVSLQMSKLPDADVARAREAGHLVNAWTINDEEPLHRAVALGVDTVTSDDPAWARRVLAGRGGVGAH